MNLGHTIKKIRIQKGIKQKYISEKLGYKSTSALSQIESGERQLRADKIPILANALGVEINELFFEE